MVFIEIVSCEDLPPYKNFTRTTFDMDPFVVVSFGKKHLEPVGKDIL